MGFIRFTGEFVIYYTIIALGGGGQAGLSWVMFDAIGIDLSALVEGWALPGGAMGVVLICVAGGRQTQRHRKHSAGRWPGCSRLWQASCCWLLSAMAAAGRGINADRESADCL